MLSRESDGQRAKHGRENQRVREREQIHKKREKIEGLRGRASIRNWKPSVVIIRRIHPLRSCEFDEWRVSRARAHRSHHIPLRAHARQHRVNAENASHRQNLFLRTREPCLARALDRTRKRVTRRRELSIVPVNTFQWCNARVHTRGATNALFSVCATRVYKFHTTFQSGCPRR